MEQPVDHQHACADCGGIIQHAKDKSYCKDWANPWICIWCLSKRYPSKEQRESNDKS